MRPGSAGSSVHGPPFGGGMRARTGHSRRKQSLSGTSGGGGGTALPVAGVGDLPCWPSPWGRGSPGARVRAALGSVPEACGHLRAEGLLPHWESLCLQGLHGGRGAAGETRFKALMALKRVQPFTVAECLGAGRVCGQLSLWFRSLAVPRAGARLLTPGAGWESVRRPGLGNWVLEQTASPLCPFLQACRAHSCVRRPGLAGEWGLELPLGTVAHGHAC